MAPDTRASRRRRWWKFAFIVMAEKDGDVAYVGSDWNEGIQPWDFGTRFDLGESPALLRGTVFTDRGVYRLGEEVHFKAVLRQNAAPRRPAASRGHAGARHRARQPGSRRRRADGQAERLEQRRLDDDAAAGGHARAITPCARFSKAIVRSRRAPEDR